MEKEYEKKFDELADNVAGQLGYRHIPWLGLTYVVMAVQMVLSMLCMFHRKDQLTMTACCVGFYILQYPQDFRRASFRGLVLMIVISVIYDIIWFQLADDVADDSDGGVEKSVKTFAFNISLLSFIWKVSI